MVVTLHGYKYSVYLRIARMVLAEKNVAYTQVEFDPFAEDVPQDYLNLHHRFMPIGQWFVRYFLIASSNPVTQRPEMKKK